jgi:apolipoprotein D and lipocalin family protein
MPRPMPTRYTGRWYEIARLPQWFEQDATAVTAEYAIEPDGKVSVINTCHKGSPTGPLEQARGTALVVDAPANSKLKVSFLWPFEGDYWILRLAPDYSAAAVGSLNRKKLWLLSRKPTMDTALCDKWTGELHCRRWRILKLIAMVAKVAASRS